MSLLPKLIVFGANGQDGRILQEIYTTAGVRDRIVPITKERHKESIRNIRNIVEESGTDSIVYLAGYNPNTFEELNQNHQTIGEFMDCNSLDFGVLLEQTHDLHLHMVYASTCRVFKKSTNLITETDAKFPDTYYSLSKFVGSNLAMIHERNRSVCTLNFFNHVSIYSKESVLYKRILASLGQKNVFNMFSRSDLDFCLDIGSAKEFMLDVVEICRQRISGEFNVCTGKKVHVGELVNELLGESYFTKINKFSSLPGYFGSNQKLMENINSSIKTTGAKILTDVKHYV